MRQDIIEAACRPKDMEEVIRIYEIEVSNHNNIIESKQSGYSEEHIDNSRLSVINRKTVKQAPYLYNLGTEKVRNPCSSTMQISDIYVRNF